MDGRRPLRAAAEQSSWRPVIGLHIYTIVTDGDLAPEGLEVFYHRGDFYLVIANETVAPGAAASNTTFYKLGWALSR